ncbi:unnamed protein product [Adineta steineri]|uniref:Uncharacterized protein n=1 Tax=Adineta steineri TaxID=433720 RepID=A0A819M7F1_9BILA|nr:unnamed protein product [Adineta steineri]
MPHTYSCGTIYEHREQMYVTTILGASASFQYHIQTITTQFVMGTMEKEEWKTNIQKLIDDFIVTVDEAATS